MLVYCSYCTHAAFYYTVSLEHPLRVCADLGIATSRELEFLPSSRYTTFRIRTPRAREPVQRISGENECRRCSPTRTVRIDPEVSNKQAILKHPSHGKPNEIRLGRRVRLNNPQGGAYGKIAVARFARSVSYDIDEYIKYRRASGPRITVAETQVIYTGIFVMYKRTTYVSIIRKPGVLRYVACPQPARRALGGGGSQDIPQGYVVGRGRKRKRNDKTFSSNRQIVF